eukprot:m.5245 g.5245  ORF g.5245 m.5245 type:complete len:490 (-) comp4169_c0_seq1:73-1542(-)
MKRGGVVVSVVLLVLWCCCVGEVEGRPGKKGIKPLLGWNTWCTQNKCAVDWCSSDEVLNVAQYMKSSGMLAAGYDHINLDDCWGLRDPKTHQIIGDPVRFPEGMKAFIAKVHALGFKFGLYTDIGEKACHSPFTGSYPYYEEDAQTFADWEVDYIKFDGCNLPAGHTPEELTCNMSTILLNTGRDFWFNFHCWHTDSCAKCGTSFRVGPDHHDEWSSTAGIIELLASQRQSFWGPNPTNGWPDPDFVFTGGQGCGVHSDPGVRCPGQTDTEYVSEFSVWAIAGGEIILASDPRNMTSFQRSVLFNAEVLAVYNDSASFESVKVIGNGSDYTTSTLSEPSMVSITCLLEKQYSDASCNLGTSFGCDDDGKTMWTNNGCRGMFVCGSVQSVECNVDGAGKHTCPCKPAPPTPSFVFARPLSNGNAAVVIHNAADFNQTLGFDFSKIPDRSWDDTTTLNVRDVWEHKNLSPSKGSFATTIPSHGVSFVILSK